MKTFFLLFLSLMLCLSSYGKEQERIIRFHSDITIETDGNIVVTEHIKVYAAGEEIKHGIIREIPLRNKKRVKVKYNILSVRCNGMETPYKTDKVSGNLEIRIGDPDVLLAPGAYDYVITYSSPGQIGFFGDFDELYWNVTGDKSGYDIEQASATVILPAGINALKTYAYTGKYGEKGQDYRIEDQSNRQTFTATRPFKTGEGMTIAVAFPKNVVPPPPPPTKFQLFWEKYKSIICGLTGLLLFGCFAVYAVRKVGPKNRKPAVVIPTFNPPRNWSPATVRFLYNQDFDQKAFTASLIAMAMKSAMTIKRFKRKFTLENRHNTQGLSPEEKEAHSRLFGMSDSIAVINNNYERFSSAESEIRQGVYNEWDRKALFDHNNLLALGGAALAFAIMTAFLFIAGGELFISALLALPFILYGLFRLGYNEHKWTRGKSWATLLIGSFVSFITWLLVMASEEVVVDIPALLFFILIPVICIYLSRRIKFYSKAYYQIQSELEGFKMYLQTAEEHLLNILTLPERTPELFEKLLSYAIALDVNNQWCKKFDSLFKKVNYNPQWYTGNEDLSTAGFATSLNKMTSLLNSSINAAKIDPDSSSSGSDGGGYSGGGGGGGGVRGW